MEENVIRKITDGDFETARRMILSIEDSIRTEPSFYNRRVLLDRVQRLKRIYNDHSIVSSPKIPLQKPISFEKRENEIGEIKDKVYVRDVCNSRVFLNDCAEIVIEDCHDVVFEHFSCEKSVILVNVKDCRVSCSGQQIRVNGCKEVDLSIHTSTGVFLQDSTGIVVRGYGCVEGNMFDNVQDFTNPFSAVNYRIL